MRNVKFAAPESNNATDYQDVAGQSVVFGYTGPREVTAKMYYYYNSRVSEY